MPHASFKLTMRDLELLILLNLLNAGVILLYRYMTATTPGQFILLLDSAGHPTQGFAHAR